jgi:hypothetical protein
VSKPVYDLAVVGGGIAGLAVAEIFARSGRSVVLIERNDRLCEEASAAQHGWFHFGSLYSIFPRNQFLRTMVGGVDDLLEYYSGLKGMNIAVTRDGYVSFPQADGCWFRDEPIEYLVCARNDPDFDMRTFEGARDYTKKLFFLMTWEMAIKQFISRHQRFHKHNWAGSIPASRWIPRAGFKDYSREVITKPDHCDVNLDRDTHFRIIGYDRPMRATAIISDLVGSLLGAGGEVRTSAEVELLEKTGGSIVNVHTSAGALAARAVILAAGKWLGRFLPCAADVKVVASPLIVASPAVSDRNFVRMTPFVEKSVNHLHHCIDGHRYSLIGGGYFADPNDPAAVLRASERLLSMARNVFPRLHEAEIIETYLGYKTEIVAKNGERNYQYVIREVDEGVHAVIPGKFSLAFSLAVNAFKRLTGEEPAKDIRLAEQSPAPPHVGLTRHATLIRNALHKEQGKSASAKGTCG